MRYTLLHPDGRVANIIELEEGVEYTPPPGLTLRPTQPSDEVPSPQPVNNDG